MIAAIGMYGQLTNLYPQYNVGQVTKVGAVNKIDPRESTNVIEKTKQTECQTCNSRKYVDGSNEGNVSFKTPGHISPESSRAVVSAHEQEHVANAVREGNEPGKELLSSSVSLRLSTCPECGTSYVSGGTTRTTIKYSANPYDQARKTIEGSFLKGQYIDLAA